MRVKNVGLKFDQELFEILDKDKAMNVEGGSNADVRQAWDSFYNGIVSIINYFTGK